MTAQLTADQASDFLISLAKEHKEDHVDVLTERGESLSVKVFRGKVEKVDQSNAQGVGVRVVREGRTGLAFTERLTAPALERAFGEARENARLMDPTEVILPEAPPPTPDPAGLGLYNPALETVGGQELGAFALAMEQAARQAAPQVAEVPYAVASLGWGETRLVSSRGVEYRQRSNRAGGYCSALLTAGDRRKSGQYGWSSRTWEPEAAQRVGHEAVRRGHELLEARAIPGGRFAVVFDEYTAPEMLGLFLGAFSAEAAQKGQSRLAGRLGEEIAWKGITLTDLPHKPGAGGSRYLDGEGVPTKDLDLIREGRFASFLYHIESARKEGRSSTGHASRGLGGGVSTTFHNLALPLGSHSLEALCAQPERCLLVTELEGAAGCNALSGDISIGVQGFWMEQGQRVQAVESVTIAGNFFDLLKGIQAVGDRYQPNLSRLFIPALLVDSMAVSG
ncbi:MAG: TldD/PmbA family protein [Deltaproteobacteria bacterium]|nr:TldD/PmbA family protein [Deltaproteobacteria bacterium]